MTVSDKRRVRVAVIAGTRPEAIKMAPVINALLQETWAEVIFIATAQHRDMLDQVMQLFQLEPDIDLDVMRQNQTLAGLTSRLLTALDSSFGEIKPDVVLAQGDTTTVMCSALAAFYKKIPFGHVEAGLRTGNLYNPFPEEANRVLAGRLARFHFAPTQRSERNLLKEGVEPAHVHVTGNTVIDALLDVVKTEPEIGVDTDSKARLILVTAHRRENFGQPIINICRAIKDIVTKRRDVQVLYPVHPNPNIHDVVMGELDGISGIILCRPLDYAPFVAAMKRAYLILTDSGGVQEEAPALGKPVLVMREDTERPEAVDEGVVKLVGTEKEMIAYETIKLLDDRTAWRAMAKGASPYGDGKAAARICAVLRTHFLE